MAAYDNFDGIFRSTGCKGGEPTVPGYVEWLKPVRSRDTSLTPVHGARDLSF